MISLKIWSNNCGFFVRFQCEEFYLCTIAFNSGSSTMVLVSLLVRHIRILVFFEAFKRTFRYYTVGQIGKKLFGGMPKVLVENPWSKPLPLNYDNLMNKKKIILHEQFICFLYKKTTLILCIIFVELISNPFSC